MRKNIMNFTLDSLESELHGKTDFKYRAEQIFRGIHKNHIFDFEKIKGLPAEVRNILESEYEIPFFSLITTTESQDKTKKFLFEISERSDNKNEYHRLETVLIKEGNRRTICISTQIGCNVGCEFCATGKMGFLKNLDVSRIILQVYYVSILTGIAPTNLVFMGMGEPFLNYENMISAIKILTDKKGIGIPSGKITVSTVGFKDKIRKFANDLVKSENRKIKNLKLALSLHSTNQGFRQSLIPVSKSNRLSDLYEELIYFYRMTKTKITYEYIFFPGLNDTDNDIKRITGLSKMIPCNINVIPFHKISFKLNPPLDVYNSPAANHNSLFINNLNSFINKLKNNKVTVNLRSSSGIDINAACGQLATKFQR
jgi:23S rRNA (adenine2503-C2)-methyltransferase